MSAVHTCCFKDQPLKQHKCETCRENVEDFNSQNSATSRYLTTETASGKLRHVPDESCLRAEALLVSEDTGPSSFEQLQMRVDKLEVQPPFNH